MFKPQLDRPLQQLLAEFSADDPEYARGRDRAEQIAKLLERDADAGVFDWRLSGSAGKGTALAPLSDIDMVVYVRGGEWKDQSGRWVSPEVLLDWLNKRIEHARKWLIQLGHIEIVPRRRCVGVVYTRDETVDIDVVPILIAGNNKDNGWIPDPSIGDYRTTSIERQFRLLNQLDTRTKDVRAGIRLLKLWSKGQDGRDPVSWTLPMCRVNLCPRSQTWRSEKSRKGRVVRSQMSSRQALCALSSKRGALLRGSPASST